MPSWNSAETLPDSELTVIIHMPNATEPIWLGYHDGEQWFTVEGTAVKDLDGDGPVAHWMEMPDPPPATSEPESKADMENVKKAIVHTLNQIRNKPEVGYYLGELTETFELPTESAAALFGEPIDKVREFYRPQNPRRPGA